MIVLTGQKQVEQLRELCENITKRLWIASPFLGSFKTIRRVLGRKWMGNPNIDLKFLTDASKYNNLPYDTVNELENWFTIKHLKGLHAKIYIIDDAVIITSANLTKTAFTMRHEMGVLIEGKEAKKPIEIFSKWWEESVCLPDLKEFSSNKKGRNQESEEGIGLKEIYFLPEDPGSIDKIYGRYNKFLDAYKDLANEYRRIGRLWDDSIPLYFEIDSFLNYLYHDDPNKPTAKYNEKPFRQLSQPQRSSELKIYQKKYHNGLKRGTDNVENRIEASKIVRDRLSKNKIKNLDIDDVRDVVSCFNCMNSMPITKYKFLNQRNNSIEEIRQAWFDLLYGVGPIQERMENAKARLRFFGNSSVQELIGFYWPEDYPIINSNSISGLKFFGYDVPRY
ncbi:MAG: phospholipase D-like domain-containing protein [bacterium]